MADWEPAGQIPGLFSPSTNPDGTYPESLNHLDDAQFLSALARSHESANEAFSLASDSEFAVKEVPRSGKKPRRSYLSRHWRGELPLPVSYWVNGFLLTMIAATAEATLGAADITTAPRLITGGYAALALSLVVVGIWQFVGIWRSAGRVIQERRKQAKGAFWAGLARIATVLGFISLTVSSVEYTFPYARANIQIAFGGDDTPHHILRILNGGSEIELAGGIDFGTAADLQTLLDATPAVRMIDLDSIGGRIAEAEHARDLIREHHLSTYTDALCASACTVVYMAGYPRYLGPEGRLGFHRYTFPGLSREQDTAANNLREQDFVNAGVSSNFAAKAFSTPSSGMWIPDRATLFLAHVATEEVNGMSFTAAAIGGQPVTADKVGRALTGVASFAALRRVDPAAFNQAVENIVTGIQQGKSMQEVMAEARVLMLAVVNKFKPVASDEIQVRIAAMTSEQARLLASDHPDICMAMLKGTSQKDEPYLTFLPTAVQTKETELTAEIIDDGFFNPSYAVDTEQTSNAEIAQLWANVRNRGVDIAGVGKIAATRDDQRSSCVAMAEFMAELSALPMQRAGALMRYLDKNP